MRIESIGRPAFEAIYERNAEIVYKTALRYTGNHHTAEELTQNVFVKLYTYMEHINLSAARSWLLVTVKNMAINHKRDGSREILSEELYENGYEEQTSMSLEDEFVKKLHERECREFTDNLFEKLYQENERWYEAVTLVYCLEKPRSEAAEIMGISVDGLYKLLQRAKRWIRKNYEDQFVHLNKA